MKSLNLKFALMLVVTLLSTQSLMAFATKELFVKYPNAYFVESGSHVGVAIQIALDAGFKKIYSIELREGFYEHCCKRFSAYPFVKPFLGDSTHVLPVVLQEINAPATFWLDAHYSGPGTAKGTSNTPLLAELESISLHHIKTHTILIDDVRLFGTEEMDFITLNDVIDKIRTINPNYEFSFEDGHAPKDILVATVRD